MDYEQRPLNRSQGGEKVGEATTSGGNFVNGKSGPRRIINASSPTSLGKVLLCKSESKTFQVVNLVVESEICEGSL